MISVELLERVIWGNLRYEGPGEAEEQTVIRPTLIYDSECWALHKSEHQRMHTTEMKIQIQGKKRKYRLRNEKFRSDAMVKSITTCVTQKRISWFGHFMRREDTNVAKHVTTMKVGGKIHRGRPRLRWMNRVRSDLRQRSKARTEPRHMEESSHDDRPRTGIRSAKVFKGTHLKIAVN